MITMKILAELNKFSIPEAIAIVLFNYERLGGFSTTNNYRKVPKDALRVGMLYVTRLINKLLVEKISDKRPYHIYL